MSEVRYQGLVIERQLWLRTGHPLPPPLLQRVGSGCLLFWIPAGAVHERQVRRTAQIRRYGRQA